LIVFRQRSRALAKGSPDALPAPAASDALPAPASCADVAPPPLVLPPLPLAVLPPLPELPLPLLDVSLPDELAPCVRSVRSVVDEEHATTEVAARTTHVRSVRMPRP
jgi:hypothetical protein